DERCLCDDRGRDQRCRCNAHGEPFDSLALSSSKGELAQDVLVEPRAHLAPPASARTFSSKSFSGCGRRAGSLRTTVTAPDADGSNAGGGTSHADPSLERAMRKTP